jgi:hypothetical protein
MDLYQKKSARDYLTWYLRVNKSILINGEIKQLLRCIKSQRIITNITLLNFTR